MNSVNPTKTTLHTLLFRHFFIQIDYFKSLCLETLFYFNFCRSFPPSRSYLFPGDLPKIFALRNRNYVSELLKPYPISPTTFSYLRRQSELHAVFNGNRQMYAITLTETLCRFAVKTGEINKRKDFQRWC